MCSVSYISTGPTAHVSFWGFIYPPLKSLAAAVAAADTAAAAAAAALIVVTTNQIKDEV